MRCAEFRHLWEDREDGAVDPARQDALGIHLADCPACQEFLREEKELDDWLDTWTAPGPPPGFDAIVARRAGLGLESPGRRWREVRLPLPFATALGLLLLASLALNLDGLLREPAAGGEAVQAVAVPAEPSAPAPATLPAREVGPSAPGTQLAVAGVPLPVANREEPLFW